VSRERRVVLQVGYLRAQRFRDDDLVRLVRRGSTEENTVRVLEERDRGARVQRPHHLLTVVVGRLRLHHRGAVDASDRNAADIIGGVQAADRLCPSRKDQDGVVERGGVAPGRDQPDDAVCHVESQPRLVSDVELQLAEPQPPADQAGVPRAVDVQNPAEAVVVGANHEPGSLHVRSQLK